MKNDHWFLHYYWCWFVNSIGLKSWLQEQETEMMSCYKCKKLFWLSFIIKDTTKFQQFYYVYHQFCLNIQTRWWYPMKMRMIMMMNWPFVKVTKKMMMRKMEMNLMKIRDDYHHHQRYIIIITVIIIAHRWWW